MKKYIPNLLTFSRIIAIPFIILLGETEHIWTLIFVAAGVAFTDFLDGFLARKWNVTSDFGKKMDAIADKLLALGLLVLLILRNPAFFYVLILEFLIAIFNLYVYFRKRVATSLLVGKLKTWFIFITILLGFVHVLFPNFSITIQWFLYITCFLQILTLFSYLLFYFHSKREDQDEFSDYVEYYEIVEPFLLHKEFLKRKKYPHHINESVYEHTIRVSFDCFKIGKRKHLDYKSLTIAALLHDFYETPWQYDKTKKPFFEQHAFTHAHNAVENAKKVYGDKITDRIAEIMETHMFPVNIRFPRSKEAWLLTLVDKTDSMDFIMHPIMLYHIFRKEEVDQQKKLTAQKIIRKIKRMRKLTKKKENK